jgi:hypothetical protein
MEERERCYSFILSRTPHEIFYVYEFSMYNMYVFTKKSIEVCIYPLSRIHNTSLISASFGLDKRECDSLEYLFIYYISANALKIRAAQSPNCIVRCAVDCTFNFLCLVWSLGQNKRMAPLSFFHGCRIRKAHFLETFGTRIRCHLSPTP